MTLPYSRTVNVTLTRNDNFPSRSGFGIPLFLTSQTVAGELDATHLTKQYGSLEEVAVDFDAGDEFYDAALQAFSQNPRPLLIKAGWYNSATVDDGAKMKTALDAIQAADNNWYWIDVESTLRDTAMAQGIVEWVEAQTKIAILTSNDVNMEDDADDTNIAAVNKGTYERTAIFYDTDATNYGGFALAASLGTRVFDDANSAYTGKYKQLNGVGAIDKASDVIAAITGFTPNIGQASATGHLANCMIDIGGQEFIVEGSVLMPNVFIDEIHASDWIVARTEEEMLAILLNNDRVSMDDDGMETLAHGPRTIMQLAARAGLIARDLDVNGDYADAFTITVPSVFSVTEAQRAARIAPAIAVTFRYAGAVHYTTVNYQMTF